MPLPLYGYPLTDFFELWFKFRNCHGACPFVARLFFFAAGSQAWRKDKCPTSLAPLLSNSKQHTCWSFEEIATGVTTTFPEAILSPGLRHSSFINVLGNLPTSLPVRTLFQAPCLHSPLLSSNSSRYVQHWAVQYYLQWIRMNLLFATLAGERLHREWTAARYRMQQELGQRVSNSLSSLQ